ncbi:DUF4239 domain-containing protein [Methylocystis sp. MJC1]|uniref:bestrophin-like domain n=1 Tax=Methylocystis sp. MJC1 TaxID=2654282 RepID=UPI0013EBB06A|nr:DUF4239 domain-containing protein [Methylocystis sp. MJC1]KAF2992463.1 hypothetical protein MJC1_00039 [Methylocystis sp. MJC1]MBU6526441.1 DUF4239 domain-containing protein [Methylocystis sp. MJC1]UZX12883.1 DUF4239 domain-containing protein [Methylocystis sp. MJC1]
MLLFLCSLPLWLGAFFTVLLPTAIAMMGPVVVRKRYPLSVLVKNNEVAGFKFATVGVIYAVILAFAIVSVWEKFSEAELLVLQEAGSSATLYRLSAGADEAAAATRTAVDTYLKTVIEDEWPRMAEGGESRETAKALDDVYTAAMRLGDSKPSAIGVEIMRELGNITQARRGRLHLAMGVVPPALWTMLVFGALLTVGFTYYFGVENLRSQVTMTGGLASIVFLGLFVIVSYDHPFTGEVSVETHPLTAVLRNFHHE